MKTRQHKTRAARRHTPKTGFDWSVHQYLDPVYVEFVPLDEYKGAKIKPEAASARGQFFWVTPLWVIRSSDSSLYAGQWALGRYDKHSFTPTDPEGPALQGIYWVAASSVRVVPQEEWPPR